MRTQTEQLRQTLLRIAAQENPPAEEIAALGAVGQRPTFLMAPLSHAGVAQGARVARALTNVVAAVDDYCTDERIHGVPRWSSLQFQECIAQYPGAVALDFACSVRGQQFVAKLCQAVGIPTISMAGLLQPLIDGVETRPLFVMAPTSGIAAIHAPGILAHAGQVIAAVDDTSTQATLHGAPRWSSREFLEKARQYPNALALDFSCTPLESGLVRTLCEAAGVERQGASLAVAQYGQHAVYESARLYRQRTLSRLDDFLHLASRLDDDLSIFTLYSNLLFRLTYDHGYLLPAWATPANEYFGVYADASTFQVGTREHFCDCGAFQGPVVRKFLEASNYRYASITAFEPDTANYLKLQEIASPCTPNFRAIRKAVSNTNEPLRFKETGTMSSHATADGNISVPSARLDDELEKLTLLKMDIEGFEAKALEGASRLISTQRPRIAVCVYHYAFDLLDVVDQLDKLVDDYHLRLRQHSSAYYYDLVLYASPVAGTAAPTWAR